MGRAPLARLPSCSAGGHRLFASAGRRSRLVSAVCRTPAVCRGPPAHPARSNGVRTREVGAPRRAAPDSVRVLPAAGLSTARARCRRRPQSALAGWSGPAGTPRLAAVTSVLRTALVVILGCAAVLLAPAAAGAATPRWLSPVAGTLHVVRGFDLPAQ